ncbi:4-hydroxythreonine-4-phosphate dehydrogenase PdxA [Candidatus Riesia pediculischaeffi]|uniref:4-hydroxythreonine-4-phosphate dehydrogenase n=1 Tax=Candidatus Riesia pediculischaeffi TaxID=428411 RepID=A0A1V0HKB3_9ENTR|nr:4-hydroxythreonine-4-phosphate dehydrogenase PdxA [Candidatus Riesia pediculischaeffi]ARC53265.1 4-hydroxythreonine-4-phosphate dehydrogenase [Candidatus Riesia pediculischaeffi]
MENIQKTFVITTGEPSGIGPDILIKLVQRRWPVRLVTISDPFLLIERAKSLNLRLNLIPYSKSYSIHLQPRRSIYIKPIQLRHPVIPGKLDKRNSKYVIEMLRKSCFGCLRGDFDGIITGPVHKGIINDCGTQFTGHTEFLASLCNIERTVMLLVSNTLKVAFLTTHVSLRDVPNLINVKSLTDTLLILHNEISSIFNIPNPIIHVCGLNPHAGEQGYFGKEEIEVISPTISALNKKGLNVHGPFPADSIFQKENLKHIDVVLAMYHDQGMPVLKNIGFFHSVNLTLGLPFIRTSVDHGTALQIAGTSEVEESSMIEALKLAIEIS